MKEEVTSELTRAQLEERLKVKSDAISDRFERLESKIPGRVPPLLDKVKNQPKLKVGAAIGAGLLVGLLFFRRSSGSKGIEYHDGLDQLSDQIAKRIAGMMDKGSNSSDAVRKALEEQPPVVNLVPEAEGLFSGAIKQLFHTGVIVFGKELATFVRDRLQEKNHSKPGPEK